MSQNQLSELQSRILDEASSWLGTKYEHRARIKGAGVDCVQLLIAVYVAVGELPPDIDTGDYPMDFGFNRDEERYLHNILRFAVPVDTPQVGDVAVFKYGRVVSHAGIVSHVAVGSEDYPYIIHAYRPERAVVVSDMMRSAHLQAHFAGYYRLKTMIKGSA